jgi:ADP-heptose:LPS heptosyltransferase
MPQSSPSVLVIRLDAIGDALALTPMLAALRERGIPVDVLLTPANAGVFSSRAVRRAIVTERVRQRRDDPENRAAIAQLATELRKNAYTHVLVATEDSAGYRLAAATRAPVRVGFTNVLGKPLKSLWSRRFVNVRMYRSAGLDRRAPHECEVLFRLARPLVGAAAPPRDSSVLRPLVLDEEPAPDDRIAVQITDKWDRLGIAFGDVVALLERLRGFGALRLLSAAGEAPFADRVETASGLTVERFAALSDWKAAIAAAPAIVTPDSGALHVAGTVGTPVAAIFPPSRAFALQTARWSPWAAPHRVVRAEAGWPARAADALAELL